MLDEVTTHLDAPTIRALAIALRHFTGAIVLITHDRWFSKVVIEGQHMEEDEQEIAPGKTYLVEKGNVRLAEGGMGEYEKLAEKRAKRF